MQLHAIAVYSLEHSLQSWVYGVMVMQSDRKSSLLTESLPLF